MQSKKTVENQSRRALLIGGGSALILSGLNAYANEKIKPLEVPTWSKTLGADAGEHLYGQPVSYEKNVTRHYNNPKACGPDYRPPMDQSTWVLTPLEDLRGTVTPNGLFFVRAHGGLPDIDPAQHRLVIHGLVDNDLMLTMDQIKRFPSVSVFHFLECSGNSDLMWVNLGDSCSEIHGLVSAAQWTGVKLSTLLEEAGIKKDKAKFILAEGADGVTMTRTIPVDRAMDDCLVVYAQNGEALRSEQGYPLRLLVPGCEGNINVKYLRRLEVSDTPFYTKDETSKYTDLNSNTGKALMSSLVMETKSVITFPSGTQQLPEKGFYEIRGIAWSGRGKITRVDVSVDGGKTWKQAKLTEPVLSKQLTEFTLPWRWNGDSAILMSRSVDETGTVQPFIQQVVSARTTASEYHNNAIQAWHVATDGKVSNVENKF